MNAYGCYALGPACAILIKEENSVVFLMSKMPNLCPRLSAKSNLMVPNYSIFSKCLYELLLTYILQAILHHLIHLVLFLLFFNSIKIYYLLPPPPYQSTITHDYDHWINGRMLVKKLNILLKNFNLELKRKLFLKLCLSNLNNPQFFYIQ